MKYKNELYHYGRSKKDGAPGPGTGNWRRGNHWGDRSSKSYKDLLSDEAYERYVSGAKLASGESLGRTIGETTTRAKQQNRYLRWARARNKRADNTDNAKRGELAENEILARKNEAKFYKKALKEVFLNMRRFSDAEVPKHFYNEDLITKAFNDVYNKEVIEPAWERFDGALNYAKNVSDSDKEFSKFTNNTELKSKYGYSDEQTNEAIDLGVSMDRLAYAEYLLVKKGW